MGMAGILKLKFRQCKTFPVMDKIKLSDCNPESFISVPYVGSPCLWFLSSNFRQVRYCLMPGASYLF